MSMKKMLLIGKTGSGKTTLCQWLHEQTIVYQKTQAVAFYDYAIDTPGEYLENRNYYSALIVTACEADIIVLLEDPTMEQSYFPPGFAGVFDKPIWGIISKMGLVTDPSQVVRARVRLKESGAQRIFEVDTLSGLGLEVLKAAVEMASDESYQWRAGEMTFA